MVYLTLGPQLIDSDIVDLPGVPESQTLWSTWILGPLNYALFLNDASGWWGKLGSGAYLEEGVTRAVLLQLFFGFCICFLVGCHELSSVFHLSHHVLLWKSLTTT